MSDVVAAVVLAMRELQIDGTDHALELMAGDFITAVIDNLDREAMARAIDPRAWQKDRAFNHIGRRWKRDDSLRNIAAALAAVRPAASDAARQAAHKGRE